MSTFPAVFPPPPNAARYGIAALNLVPTFQTSPTLNPNAREKSWQEAFDPTLNPNQATVKYYYDATGTYQPFVITNGDAMAPPNLAPVGQTPAQEAALQGSVFELQPAFPVPARALLPTESIDIVMGVVWVVNSAYVEPPQPQTTQQSTDSQNIAECVKILRAAFPNLV